MPIPEMSSASRNPLRGAVEIIPNRLYYCALREPMQSHKILIRNPFVNTTNPDQKFPVVCFNIDDELVYWNFFLDFGPLNLGQLYRFTTRLNRLLVQAKRDDATVLFYSSAHDNKRANAIFLVCAWQVLELNRSPAEAFRGFSTEGYDGDTGSSNSNNNNATTGNKTGRVSSSSNPPLLPLSAIGGHTIETLPPFHDASPYRCSYELTLLDCLGALVKARRFNFFDWGEDFDVKEYEYFEQVENGDLNWIVKDKILAFAGPSYTKNVTPEGYCTLSPGDYIPYFLRKNVGLVVRLNQKNYDEQQFLDAGIDHLEQFYTDGSCPNMGILRKVVDAFDKVPHDKGFAVHCKAGLGRTGTCIGAYLMKHYHMTAKEVIGWMRICRPGMVIGPQQRFLEQIQPVMWMEGELMKTNLRVCKDPTAAVPSSPSSRSMSTATTVPESPGSLILVTSNSKELGHEVILGADHRCHRYEEGDGESSSFQQQLHQLKQELHNEREGRPGQADGLLAARHRQQQQQQDEQEHPQPPASPETSMDLSSPPGSPIPSSDRASDTNDATTGEGQAVPVTPINRATPAPSIWARAFA